MRSSRFPNPRSPRNGPTKCLLTASRRPEDLPAEAALTTPLEFDRTMNSSKNSNKTFVAADEHLLSPPPTTRKISVRSSPASVTDEREWTLDKHRKMYSPPDRGGGSEVSFSSERTNKTSNRSRGSPISEDSCEEPTSRASDRTHRRSFSGKHRRRIRRSAHDESAPNRDVSLSPKSHRSQNSMDYSYDSLLDDSFSYGNIGFSDEALNYCGIGYYPTSSSGSSSPRSTFSSHDLSSGSEILSVHHDETDNSDCFSTIYENADEENDESYSLVSGEDVAKGGPISIQAEQEGQLTEETNTSGHHIHRGHCGIKAGYSTHVTKAKDNNGRSSHKDKHSPYPASRSKQGNAIAQYLDKNNLYSPKTDNSEHASESHAGILSSPNTHSAHSVPPQHSSVVSRYSRNNLREGNTSAANSEIRSRVLGHARRRGAITESYQDTTNKGNMAVPGHKKVRFVRDHAGHDEDLTEEDITEARRDLVGGKGRAGTNQSRNKRTGVSSNDDLHSLASSHMKNGEYQAGLALFQDLLNAQRQSHGEFHPLIASTWHNIGIAHARLGETNLATRAFRSAVHITTETLGQHHPLVAKSLIQIGFQSWREQQYEDATSSFRRALEIRVASFGQVHPLVAKVHANLAMTFLRAGNLPRAREEFDNAFEIERAVVATLHNRNSNDEISPPSGHEIENAYLAMATTLSNIGALLLGMEGTKGAEFNDNNMKEAVASLQEALKVQTAILGRNHSTVHETRSSLALARERLEVSFQRQSNALRQSAALETNGEIYPDDSVSNSGDSVATMKPWSKDSSAACSVLKDEGGSSCSSTATTCSMFSSDESSVFDDITEADSSTSEESRADDLALKTMGGLEDLAANPDLVGESAVPRITTRMLSNPKAHSEEIYRAAELSVKQHSFGKALHLFEVLLSHYLQTYGESHSLTGSTLHNIGIIYLMTRSYNDALEAFEHAVITRLACLGDAHPHVADSMVKKGAVLLIVRRLEDSLTTFHEALSVCFKAYGHVHVLTAKIFNNIGCVHAECHNWNEALEAYESALDVQRSLLEECPNDRGHLCSIVTSLCNLGNLYQQIKKFGICAAYFREAMSIQESSIGPRHQQIIPTLCSFGNASAKCGEFEDAIEAYTRILSLLPDGGAGGGEEEDRINEYSADILARMGRVQAKQQHFEPCLSNLRTALITRRNRLRLWELQGALRRGDKVFDREERTCQQLRVRIEKVERILTEQEDLDQRSVCTSEI